jgi:hypothetical protein
MARLNCFVHLAPHILHMTLQADNTVKSMGFLTNYHAISHIISFLFYFILSHRGVGSMKLTLPIQL